MGKKGKEPNGQRAAANYSPPWCVPGSVISALWTEILPRLAAMVWRGDYKWPVGKSPDADVWDPVPVQDELLHDLWEAMARIAFGSPERYRELRAAHVDEQNSFRFSRSQGTAHVVLRYFADQSKSTLVPIRVIRADAYDFILSPRGMDVFIPPDPFGREHDDELGRRAIIQMYKFRKTGNPPIGLPGLPRSSPDGNGGDGYLIPIPQLTAPTGAYQIQEDWARNETQVAWWLSGTAYRGMMAELPRIIASKWYEEVAWPPARPGGKPPEEGGDPWDLEEWAETTTYRRFYEAGEADADSPAKRGLKGLLEERMETSLPSELVLTVVRRSDLTRCPPMPPGAEHCEDWNPCDVMITNEGIYIPDPGAPPSADQLLDSIVAGQAGNPVFTDTPPPTGCDGG